MPERSAKRGLALVAVGGALGTLLRFGVTTLFDGAPTGTLVVNVLGAAALGFLLGLAPWAPAGPGSNQAGQAFFGTGLLGGFTTYSALALDVITLPTAWAVGYAAATVMLGVGAAICGILLGRWVRDRRAPSMGGSR